MSKDTLRQWGVIFLFVTLIGLLSFGVIVTDAMSNRESVNLVIPFINEMTGAYSVFLLLPPVLWFMQRWPLTRERLAGRLPLHLLASIVFGAGHTLLMIASRTLIYSALNLGTYAQQYGMLKYRFLMEYQKQFLIYWLIYGVVYLLKTLREKQAQKLHATRLQQELTAAQLQSLQMQLNPHFLFNTLNLISSTMHEDVEAADSMLADLSDLLRTTLNSTDWGEHALQKELDLAEMYLNIMRARFHDKLSVKYEIAAQAKEAAVPGLILQPLLENAIKYSIENVPAAEIEISAQVRNDTLHLAVRDNGPGLPGSAGNTAQRGVGISNTVARLEKLYGEKHHFQLQNRTSGGVEVVIEIPFKKYKAGTDENTHR